MIKVIKLIDLCDQSKIEHQHQPPQGSGGMGRKILRARG